MIEIYHSTGTRGLRAIWACEELGVPYRIVPVDFSAAYRATAQWREMNPVGKVPVMRDGDLQIFESGAMVQHLLDRHGQGRLQPPVGTPERAAYLQWSWFAEATFSRPLGEITNHRRAFPAPIEACIEEMRDRARLCVQALDAQLAGRDYVLGEAFSGADIMLGYSLLSFARNCPDDVLPENVAGYSGRLSARPGHQATLAAEQVAGRQG